MLALQAQEKRLDTMDTFVEVSKLRRKMGKLEMHMEKLQSTKLWLVSDSFRGGRETKRRIVEIQGPAVQICSQRVVVGHILERKGG